MGVYIKNMTMPKHCIDCPFMISRDNDDCILQSEESNESAKTWDDLKAKCPLSEDKATSKTEAKMIIEQVNRGEFPPLHDAEPEQNEFGLQKIK